MVVCSCNSSYSGGKDRRIAVQMDGSHTQRALARAKEPGVQKAAKVPTAQDGPLSGRRLL
jgi:hypothetical protein